MRAGEKALIPAFTRAIQMPAYAGLLKAKGVPYTRIRTVQAFKDQVPIFRKEDIFSDFDVATLCVGGNLETMKMTTTACGLTGPCSFGINTEYNQRMIRQSTDTSLEYLFQTDRKKTFLINCMPMGVKIPTSLPSSETSVRSDMALDTVKKFSSHFDQTLIVGEPFFIKKLIEQGVQENIDFRALGVNILFAGDWFSESFRQYIAHLMGLRRKDREAGRLYAMMGIAELGLNLFHESYETVRLRHKAQYEPGLMRKLFGVRLKTCPIIYQYYPQRIFLETTGRNELVSSVLDRHFVTPLMRYNSRDIGFLISYEALKEILISESASELIPELKLPLVAIAGRRNRHLTLKGKTVTAEDIMQGLYSFAEAASATTGYFVLSSRDTGASRGRVAIQLKKGVVNDARVKKVLKRALLEYCDEPLKVVVYDYADFPYGMELDYETRFSFVD